MQHHRVDQHEVAERQFAVDDALRGEDHDAGDADRDDRRLAEIQHRHRGLALDRGLFPVPHGAAVALDLVAVVVEILDRLVVHQAVHRAAVGARIERVHLVAEMHAPLGHQQREADVDQHGEKDHAGEQAVVLAEQDQRDQQELGRGRHDVEHEVVQDRADALRAALEVARDRAGVALEVVAQRQVVQVRQHCDRELAHRVKAHPREHRVAQFVEARVNEAQQAVDQQQQQRQREHLARLGVERVDDVFQHYRHADHRHLRNDQAD